MGEETGGTRFNINENVKYIHSVTSHPIYKLHVVFTETIIQPIGPGLKASSHNGVWIRCVAA
jgi:hypothetical protein